MQKTQKIPIIIVGNKVDLDEPGQRAVTTKEGQDLAERYGAKFLECSAKTNINIREIFEQLVLYIDEVDPKRGQKKSSCRFLQSSEL